MKNTNYIKPIAIGVGIGGLILLLTSSKKEAPQFNEPEPTEGSNQDTPPPKPLPTMDPNKVVAKGSTGLEVKELQRLLGFKGTDIDGIFGNDTETRLFTLKGVKKVSVNQYNKLPLINRNVLAIGTKIMANINFSTPTNLYEAFKKADGTYESTGKVETTVDYGEEVGEIIGKNTTATWYLVEKNTFWGKELYFVKATDIKKI